MRFDSAVVHSRRSRRRWIYRETFREGFSTNVAELAGETRGPNTRGRGSSPRRDGYTISYIYIFVYLRRRGDVTDHKCTIMGLRCKWLHATFATLRQAVRSRSGPISGTGRCGQRVVHRTFNPARESALRVRVPLCSKRGVGVYGCTSEWHSGGGEFDPRTFHESRLRGRSLVEAVG